MAIIISGLNHEVACSHRIALSCLPHQTIKSRIDQMLLQGILEVR